jgi:hypothetical protein
MLFAIASLSLALLVGAPADVTGKWEGTLTGQRPDGTTSEDGAYMVLEQKGTAVTGTVGGNANDQHPITSGSLEGAKLTLLARNANNDREYKIELTLDGDVMKGTVTSGERSGQVSLKRLKQ